MSIKCVKSVISVKSTHRGRGVMLLKLFSVKVTKVLKHYKCYSTKRVRVLKMSQVLNVF